MALRLDKYLADSGVGSRKEVKDFIKKGRITVNEQTVTSADLKVDPERDIVSFDEVRIDGSGGFKYFIMNKPQGVITATEDRVQKTVLDLLDKKDRKGLSPVGRLDKDTSGMLILTDDGEFNHRLMAPKKHVSKTYLVGTDIPFDEKDAISFSLGLDIGDDTPCKSAILKVIKDDHSRSEEISYLTKSVQNEISASKDGIYYSLITITEGRYHQIKRMAKACGKNVILLKRVGIGGLSLPEDLKEGCYRKLTGDEMGKLTEDTGM